MNNTRLADYLGVDVHELLKTHPFSCWGVSRYVEEDPETQIWYEFTGHGVEVTCDGDERIRSIFVRRGDGEELAEVSFSSSRREVLERYGTPAKSGAAVRIPALGDKGAWDRFTRAGFALHVQYRLDRDEVDMITIMRPDVVP